MHYVMNKDPDEKLSLHSFHLTDSDEETNEKSIVELLLASNAVQTTDQLQSLIRIGPNSM